MIETFVAELAIDLIGAPFNVPTTRFADILTEFEKISGVPCLINTSFNMHEEPIVCSPRDAVRAFLLGNLDGLAIGPYFVAKPGSRAA